MKTILSDYQKHVKPYRLEEPCDFVLYRPLAYGVFKLTEKLPLTPNHFSLLNLVIAFSAAFQLSQGTTNGFFLGGVGIFLFSVFDCVDGMVARAKKNGSPYGEQIDMFVDMLSNIAFFVCLYVGLTKAYPETYYPVYLLIGFLSIFIHSSLYNYYKRQYQFYGVGNVDGLKREIEACRRKLNELKQKNERLFERLLLTLFIKYSQAQTKNSNARYSPEDYIRFNRSLLPLWAIISGSSHLTVLAFALMVDELSIYFLASILLANTWMILTYIVQNGVNRTMGRVS
jgi:phosphatidylglycerophosphate synthase